MNNACRQSCCLCVLMLPSEPTYTLPILDGSGSKDNDLPRQLMCRTGKQLPSEALWLSVLTSVSIRL